MTVKGELTVQAGRTLPMVGSADLVQGPMTCSDVIADHSCIETSQRIVRSTVRARGITPTVDALQVSALGRLVTHPHALQSYRAIRGEEDLRG